jgi:hypothetical protein
VGFLGLSGSIKNNNISRVLGIVRLTEEQQKVFKEIFDQIMGQQIFSEESHEGVAEEKQSEPQMPVSSPSRASVIAPEPKNPQQNR